MTEQTTPVAAKDQSVILTEAVKNFRINRLGLDSTEEQPAVTITERALMQDLLRLEYFAQQMREGAARFNAEMGASYELSLKNINFWRLVSCALGAVCVGLGLGYLL
jgi:hypothetical protein